MSVIQRVVKATTRKGKKVLLKREPQFIEPAKRVLLLKGRKTSEVVRHLLKDFFDIRKPLAHIMSNKNDITIFENINPVEEFCRKYESPLFVLGSHNKKRPNNVVFGRMFDYSLLDMVEVGIDSYTGLKEFHGPKITLGSKPTLIFNGPGWEESEELKHLKSIFVDIFQKEKAESVRLQGLEHAISFTAKNGKILLRSYKILLKKSGCRTPRIELEEIETDVHFIYDMACKLEMDYHKQIVPLEQLFRQNPESNNSSGFANMIEELGPRVEFSIRRTKLASEDLMKQACKKPKELKPHVKKNITKDGLGSTHGRIHLGKQPIDRLQTRKMKGLRKTAEEKKQDKISKRSATATDTNELLVKKRMRLN